MTPDQIIKAYRAAYQACHERECDRVITFDQGGYIVSGYYEGHFMQDKFSQSDLVEMTRNLTMRGNHRRGGSIQ